MDIGWIIIFVAIGLGVLFCLCLAIANYAPERFFDIYKEIDDEEAYCRLSTQEFAQVINMREFRGKLRVHVIENYAGDAYVRGGDLLLSTNTLSSSSVAAYATLAHELGHALQDRDTNKLKVKSILTRISKIIGPFLFPSLIAGIILIAFMGVYLYYGIALLGLGAFIFALSIILKFVTIRIEKDASKRAIIMLQDYLGEEQLKSAKRMLNSAKLTYWGSLFKTLLGWTMLTKNGRYRD